MRNYYILVGDNRTWRISFTKNFWGFTEKTKKLWSNIEKEDIVCFYVTKPTKKIIGFGKIKKKFQNTEIFWPDEIFLQRVLWPYKIEFEPIYIVDNFDDGIDPPLKVILNQGRKKISEDIFIKLIQEAEKWNMSDLKKLKI